MNPLPTTVAIPGYLAGTRKADPVHSEIAFSVRRLMIRNHLRSADYLDVEKHPTMGYRSTGIRQTDDGWVIDGELTLHGVSWQVPLADEVNGFGPDPWGGQRAGFSATAHINRRDVGIATTIPMDAVDDKVSISLEIEAVLQK